MVTPAKDTIRESMDCAAQDTNSLIAELRLLNQRKDRFITVLAHELRGPLAPIANAIEVLTVASTDSQLVPHACSIIRRQMWLLKRLVDDLFDISRISRGAVELKRAPVDLRVVLDTAVETVRPFIELRGQRFTSALPGNPVMVDADAARLAQVFTNLLHNAAKYTDGGGHIEVSAERVKDAAVISVRDSGIGIAPEALSGIFELFVRAGPESERDAGGLGIGLALARQLLELHGGAISAHSEGLGRGSEFIVRLPLSHSQEHSNNYNKVD